MHRQITRGQKKVDKLKIIYYKRKKEIDMNKIAWEKPELIVLTRGKPEENVLWECKFNTAPDRWGGIQTYNGHGCQAEKSNSCMACQSLGGGAGS